jgi:Alginate export
MRCAARLFWIACFGSLLPVIGSAQTPSASPAVPPAAPPAPATPAVPPYTPVRFNENYAYLATAPDTDFFDPIKYIPLGPDDWYLSLGGQARYRYEYFNNENFGAVENDWGYALQRYMLHADAHLGNNFRAFVQLRSSLVDDGRELPTARPIDADEIDIEQLFFDVALPVGDDKLTLRLGRQNLLFGAQRLIGPLDWTNTRRTFDGARLTYQVGKDINIDAFLTRPVIVEADEFNDGNGNSTFWGIYGTWNVPQQTLGGNAKLEAYVLGLSTRPTASAVDVDTYTIGARLSGAPKPWDYDIEVDYQFGKSGAGDINAYSVALEGGYTFAGAPLTPRVFAGFDYASGDDDATDLDKGTFNQLFPTGHLYFGYIDVIGRANIIDVHPGVELTLLANAKYAKKLSLRGDYHVFWRADTNDGLYGVAGNLTKPAGTSGESFIGSEVDLFLNWQIDRHLNAYIGYSHFFAGDFIDASAADDDIDFFYAALTYTF